MNTKPGSRDVNPEKASDRMVPPTCVAVDAVLRRASQDLEVLVEDNEPPGFQRGLKDILSDVETVVKKQTTTLRAAHVSAIQALWDAQDALQGAEEELEEIRAEQQAHTLVIEGLNQERVKADDRARRFEIETQMLQAALDIAVRDWDYDKKRLIQVEKEVTSLRRLAQPYIADAQHHASAEASVMGTAEVLRAALGMSPAEAYTAAESVVSYLRIKAHERLMAQRQRQAAEGKVPFGYEPDPDPLSDINRRYKLNYKIGDRVLYSGSEIRGTIPGVIEGAAHGLLVVRLENEDRVGRYHPTWRIQPQPETAA